MKNYKVGDIIQCEVTGVTNYGVFVKIDDNYNGLIHISEISNEFVDNIEKLYMKNDIVNAMIIEILEDKKQIKLSIKQMNDKNIVKPIKEKGKGFLPLRKNLNNWINTTLKKLKK